MSDSLILDGTGKGYRAKVDEKNRLQVLCTSKTMAEAQTEDGCGWFISTDFLTLSNAGVNPIFYFKNFGNTDVSLLELRLSLGAAGGDATSICSFSIYSNPSDVAGGEIIYPVNKKIGDAKPFEFESKQATGASPITASNLVSKVDVTDLLPGQFHDHDTYLVVPRGNAILVAVELAGAQPIQARFSAVGYLEE